MRKAGFILIAILLLAPPRAWAAQGVVDTLHNLSASGPGLVKAMTVSRVCVFCHTPHNGTPSAPLWNRPTSGSTYIEYQSTTQQASAGQPTGSSRLCLSCHDGTVALGALANLPGGRKTDLAQTFLTGRGNLGTDLSDDHPVSFRFDNALQAKKRNLVPPGKTGLPLENGDMQCTSCHDPHEKDLAPFLRKSGLNGELCTSCHDQSSGAQSWDLSSHATAGVRPKAGSSPWSERKPAWRGETVAENACFNCHAPHSAVTPQRLIKDKEEETCYRCHDGTVAATDIRADMLKPSRHPVGQTSKIHDAAEDFALDPPPDHVECSDCHNPHNVASGKGQAPFLPGSVRGVSGIDSTGASVPEANRLDQVCYKCHADNNVALSPVVTRQIFDLNTRLEFDIASPSHHAVQGQGRNSSVPSMIAPYTETSILHCTDCHNSDSAGGAKGPHGSTYRPLLELSYTTTDNTGESSVAYALCYKCHSRTSILADESFSEHRLHVVDQNTPCSACHDPHGVNAIQGNPFNNSHLINFDVEIVQPNSLAEGPVFEDLGVFTGQCSLSCHGKDHQSLKY